MGGNTSYGILKRITETRRERIAREGFTLGADVPSQRKTGQPIVPFFPGPICEIKRRSPSRGVISGNIDPVVHAGRYREQGVRSISVLTEENFFDGSLQDLMNVKRSFPDLFLLRKDFLLEEEDIEISYRAGADAVLLIAAILSSEKLASLYTLSRELGLSALVEIHNSTECAAVRDAGIQPELMGINARNLDNFQVDLLAPLLLRRDIPWPCNVVFESGIFAPEQVGLLMAHGFHSALVGEAAVRRPDLAGELVQSFSTSSPPSRSPSPPAASSASKSSPPSRSPSPPAASSASGVEFWTAIMNLKETAVKRPIVKICGICNSADARRAVDLGADVLGLVFADSPRRAPMALLDELADVNVLKVAVCTDAPNDELRNAFMKGLIHAFQYHGNESPRECLERGLPFYKALRVREKADLSMIMNYPSPRVLVDAWDDRHAGGTGRRLNSKLARAAAAHKPLWLAGGLNPENVVSVIQDLRPELIDVSSGLELEPGKKDEKKLVSFFEELKDADIS